MMKSLVIKVDNPCALLWLLRLPANALAEFMNRPASSSVTRRWWDFSALSGAVFLWEARPRADGCLGNVVAAKFTGLVCVALVNHPCLTVGYLGEYL
jgi:hypothetical protein